MKKLTQLLNESDVKVTKVDDCVYIEEKASGLQIHITVSQAKRLCNSLKEIIEAEEAYYEEEELLDVTPLDFVDPFSPPIFPDRPSTSLEKYRFRN